MNRSKLIRKFDRQARVYEKQRNMNMLGDWRHKLLQRADGDVLELAVGAGANFSYYPPDVNVLAVDFSPGMLDKAKEATEQSRLRQVTFKQADIETLDFPDDSIDTIVSTLSFCGYEQPMQMLNKVNRWCKPSGQVLLLEHGASLNPALSFIQKSVDPLSHRIVGCHMDRDILGLVEASDLYMDMAESHWRGIFHLIWARPGD
ncbi:class I SAM-dependent methyltransferase [Natribacillus halophilus]|uniref:Ubiquinone/menaquinone biosynthesis C-methylase UbiE n=1 Tax=Natribacillus halophilus TaxID=549003 RepID=A0A1G8QNM7_9BACI|nr:class I SAM-dependent methyltransferase [Natribacillus halophilus]SDJ06288.1 Ubiquinone/menaquinone biosynthesis C-methylase UbiE [Natribacillus halophilus]